MLWIWDSCVKNLLKKRDVHDGKIAPSPCEGCEEVHILSAVQYLSIRELIAFVTEFLIDDF